MSMTNYSKFIILLYYIGLLLNGKTKQQKSIIQERCLILLVTFILISPEQ